jgi:hypothetical protein
MRRIGHGIAALGLAGLVIGAGSPPVAGQAEDPQAAGDDYTSGDYGRVTDVENGATIRRGYDDPTLAATAEATPNAPVFPGDALVTDADQRVEVQLASGTMVRIDRGAALTFLSLPDPYAEYRDNSVLQLSSGALRIGVRIGEGEEFRVDTPGSSIYLLGDGDFRIEVDSSGRTEVQSRRGVAEVVGNGGSVLIRAGMRTEVLPEAVPEEAWAYNTLVGDDFDRWIDRREAFYQDQTDYEGTPAETADAYESVPDEVQPYYRELSHYGSWTWVDDYGYVWYPRTVAPGWRPYYDGYWAYSPGGYFWVSNEPWGWAPYHYGRWSWCGGYGWCWVPGQVFAGAWVAWSWGSAYVGWAPLDYWGRPCHAYAVHYGYYDPYAWSFVHYDHLYQDHARYAVRVDATGDHMRHAVVVSRAPRIPPTDLARSPASREAAVRQARGDLNAAMRQVSTTSRPAATFRDQESALRQRGAAPRPGARAAASRGAAAPGAAEQRSATGRTSAFPEYPRRMTTQRPANAAARRGTAPGAQATAPGSRSAAPPVRSREGSASGVEQRVRDLYRRMANPRAPQQSGAVQPRRTQEGSRSAPPSATPPRASERGTQPAKPSPAPATPRSREDARGRSQPGSAPRAGGAKQGEQRGSSAPERREQAPPASPPRERREERSEPGRTSVSSAPMMRPSASASALRGRPTAPAPPRASAAPRPNGGSGGAPKQSAAPRTNGGGAGGAGGGARSAQRGGGSKSSQGRGGKRD